MAKPTLASLRAELEALRHNASLVETERDSLRDEVAKLKAAAPARTSKPAYVRPGPTEAQRIAHEQYVATLMAARALAMKTGRSVRVGE